MNVNQNKKPTKSRIDPADTVIASRLYKKRCTLGFSQKDLAEYTGVSIQQIQKYEKSTNRISGGRLYRFAQFLNVSITYFFDNIDEEINRNAGRASSSLAEEQEAFFADENSTVSEKEVITLVKFYNGIKDYSVRRKFVDLMRAVSSSCA